jgi:3-phenylpropionate/trans-cinnamate dioxygenase ferredoxin subunit
MALIEVCPVEELPPGSMKLVPAGLITVGVYNCGGEFFALEDRCSHDDGPLVEGDWEPDRCVVICPRHGANFDIRTGQPLTLPAYEPVETFRVVVEDGVVKVDVDV